MILWLIKRQIEFQFNYVESFMKITLDEITRKKLILVRQLIQRAILQAEAKHSYVDRIMALICFDLTNETILKAVVSAINSTVTPKSDFQAIIQQADNELVTAGLPPVPDKARIQHVRTLSIIFQF